MKVIGLIGGMIWDSTLEYYRLANELASLRLGSLHIPPTWCSIASTLKR